MKPSLKDNDNLLFKWFFTGLKYFLLALLGLAVAFVVSHAFGAEAIVGILLSESLRIWVGRIAIALVCLFAIAMILESWG
ncbi:MAG: hypothetical protein V7L04_20130 [Nostoc sp.]|uniref:hypothetical protein n=1 Tax=Nostoc sp. TaxID=1180 RepID=UPI002FF703C2